MKLTGEKREAIRLRLEELERAGGGRLTPQAVVNDAQDADSPLHDQFNWDVNEAALQHWLDQARQLIVSVKYVFKNETTTVRAVYYHRDPTAAGGEQGYVSVPTLRTDQDLARDALVEAFRRVGDELRRAQQLAIMLDMDGEVAKLLDGVIELRQRISDTPLQVM